MSSTIAARKIVDFATVSDGWHALAWSIGPRGDATLLLADRPRPWQAVPSDLPADSPAWVEPISGYRLLHFAEGHDAGRQQVLGIPGTERIWQSARFADGRWLVVVWPSGRVAEPNARVLDRDGTFLYDFWIGMTGVVQLTGDGRIWTGYGDETINAGSELEWGGIVCLDDHGSPLFRFNFDAAGNAGAPGVWCSAGINVVSDDEVWVSYFADTQVWNNARVTPAAYALAKINGYSVAWLWPWEVVTSKIRSDTPDQFAVHDGRLLVQGLVTLANEPAKDHLPVDHTGDWIGPFRSQGRGSRLYLATKTALYVVDAASISESSPNP
jgi:hypothetical protein